MTIRNLRLSKIEKLSVMKLKLGKKINPKKVITPNTKITISQESTKRRLTHIKINVSMLTYE